MNRTGAKAGSRSDPAFKPLLGTVHPLQRGIWRFTKSTFNMDLGFLPLTSNMICSSTIRCKSINFLLILYLLLSGSNFTLNWPEPPVTWMSLGGFFNEKDQKLMIPYTSILVLQGRIFFRGSMHHILDGVRSFHILTIVTPFI